MAEEAVANFSDFEIRARFDSLLTLHSRRSIRIIVRSEESVFGPGLGLCPDVLLSEIRTKLSTWKWSRFRSNWEKENPDFLSLLMAIYPDLSARTE